MIQPETGYPRFLDRAVHGLTAAGAQSLEVPALASQGPNGWTDSWDRILLSDSPGAPTVFAFTDATGSSSSSLRARINSLASGLSELGMLHGPPLRLVTIAVFPGGMGQSRPRSITGITPDYLPGLRPVTWAADLSGRKLYRGRAGSSDARAIEAALGDALQGEVVDARGIAVLEQENARRSHAFYALMRGRKPVVTAGLIAVNVAVFALMYFNGSPTSDSTLQGFGALSPRLVESGQWWRLFTAIFLHAGIPHIVFNMVSLFAIGTLAERLYGSARYLAIYLGAGLAGSLASFGYSVVTHNLDVLGVGASGAIFGLAGALLTIRFQHSDVIPLDLRRRLSTSLLPLILLNLAVAYATPHVDNSAHIGGLIGGALLSFLLPVTRSARDLR